MDLLRREVPASSLVVAIDLGKAFNRAWLTSGERGLIGEPVSLPVLRDGIEELDRLINASGVSGPPVIGLEKTGALHRAWAVEIERRWPGSLRFYPGLSAPPGHGWALKLESATGQPVLECAAAFAGRAASKRSLIARAPGRMTDATAAFWVGRWKRLLDPPPDAELRAVRLGQDLRRWQQLHADIALAESRLAGLLDETDGQILTTLPGVAAVRAAEFSAYTLPIERWPTP